MEYTKSQEQCFITFVNFVNSEDRILIVKGYAGTGKTTVIKDFVGYLNKKGKVSHLLASTGRAAKILSSIAKSGASTIHSEIYKFDDLNENIGSVAQTIEREESDEEKWLFPKFDLCMNVGNSDIFIIDESSMISDVEDKNPEVAIFGSGKLLSDLMLFAPKAKFIFVGDNCQLPPVKQNFSPALNKAYFLKYFGLNAHEATLTEVVRQKNDNDIVSASQMIRNLIFNSNKDKMCHKFPLKNYKDIYLLPTATAMVDNYVKDIKSMGYGRVTFICRSNKRASELTSDIRPKLGFKQQNIQARDLLLVTQNNLISGLLNGDLVRVISIGETIKRAKLTFIRVQVEELSSKKRYSQYLIQEPLFQNIPRLTRTQQRNLYIDFYNRMKARGIYQSSKEFKEGLFKDEYLNALRGVFGYVLTCHKAQGGEWSTVYLDISRELSRFADKGKYRWLYTAMTRAKQSLYLCDNFWLE